MSVVGDESTLRRQAVEAMRQLDARGLNRGHNIRQGHSANEFAGRPHNHAPA